VKTIALLLTMMVPCSSFAHGFGPDEDAPVMRQPPSARLLPQEPPVTATAETAPQATPAYKSVGLWAGLAAGTVVTLAVAFVLGVLFGTHAVTDHVQALPPSCGSACMGSAGAAPAPAR
jgi:hypothetical protein